jgi:hypothetical protein
VRDARRVLTRLGSCDEAQRYGESAYERLRDAHDRPEQTRRKFSRWTSSATANRLTTSSIRCFDRWPRLCVAACSWALVATIGGVDYVTGVEASVTLLYLIPVALRPKLVAPATIVDG